MRTSAWDEFAARFAPDAQLEFIGVPVGPFVGRDAIAAAYAASPPDDTMTVVSADADEARFRWDHGGTGTMVFQWDDAGLVQTLQVHFD